MAAGLGSRFGGLKQMACVGPSHEWLLDFSIRDAIQSGFHKIILVIQPAMEAEMKAHLKGYAQSGVSFIFAHQLIDVDVSGLIDFDISLRKKPWGTAHAVLSASPYVNEPFVVLNADDYYGPHALSILGHYLDHSISDASFVALLGYELGKTLSDNGPVSRAICEMNDLGHVVDLKEYTALKNTALGIMDQKSPGILFQTNACVSLNAWAFSMDFLTHLQKSFIRFLNNLTLNDYLSKEYYLPVAAMDFSKNENLRMHLLRTHDHYCGLTYAADLASIQVILKAQT
jgi:hypothetical protein